MCIQQLLRFRHFLMMMYFSWDRISLVYVQLDDFFLYLLAVVVCCALQSLVMKMHM